MTTPLNDRISMKYQFKDKEKKQIRFDALATYFECSVTNIRNMYAAFLADPNWPYSEKNPNPETRIALTPSSNVTMIAQSVLFEKPPRDDSPKVLVIREYKKKEASVGKYLNLIDVDVMRSFLGFYDKYVKKDVQYVELDIKLRERD